MRRPGDRSRPVSFRLLLDVALEVAQGATHHGVRERGTHRAWNEAAGVDPQVELGVGAAVPARLEPPFAGEVAEIAAEVLAGHPPRLVVDLAKPVADRLEAGVDLVLDDRPAALLVTLHHASPFHGALP